jgi:hypothetical protein
MDTDAQIADTGHPAADTASPEGSGGWHTPPPPAAPDCLDAVLMRLAFAARRLMEDDGDSATATGLAAVVRHLVRRASMLTPEQRGRASGFLAEGWPPSEPHEDRADDQGRPS